MKTSQPNLSYLNYCFEPDSNDSFLADITALLTGKAAGHMEKWEYGEATYSRDPAGGAVFWHDLIKNPQHYYLYHGEQKLIQDFCEQDTATRHPKFTTVIELGPGDKEALAVKTIPFLSSLCSINSYLAIDSEPSQATSAALYIQENFPFASTLGVKQNFESLSLNFPRSSPAALIMWGCTFGNISGRAYEEPSSKLRSNFLRLNSLMASGDYIFLTFDTEHDGNKILKAYNQPLLSACFLSPLHRLMRDNLAKGVFDANKWRHESIWIPETMQCAHTIYPLDDQNFDLCGKAICIPKNKRFITNNSYKFKPETMIAISQEAGFVSIVHQHGPMTMLIAKKP